MAIIDTITALCIQDAMYWPPGTSDGYNSIIYPDPTEVKCRWEDVQEVIQIGINLEEVICTSKVYVLQDMQEEGLLFLGDTGDMESAATTEVAYKIVKFKKTPALGSTTDFIRVAYLSGGVPISNLEEGITVDQTDITVDQTDVLISG